MAKRDPRDPPRPPEPQAPELPQARPDEPGDAAAPSRVEDMLALMRANDAARQDNGPEPAPPPPVDHETRQREQVRGMTEQIMQGAHGPNGAGAGEAGQTEDAAQVLSDIRELLARLLDRIEQAME